MNLSLSLFLLYEFRGTKKNQKLTIAALVSDETLMGSLVLKGGNALDLAYNIISRGSIDIDFSLAGLLSEIEQLKIKEQAFYLLSNEFKREDLIVFDVKFYEKPKVIDEHVKNFRGGYKLEFKVITKDKYDCFNGNIDVIRRNAIPLWPDNSPIFYEEISKYEYIADKQLRDFYDIYNLLTSFNIDFTTPKNIELARNIFDAKKVPLTYIAKINEYYELHNQSWEAVKQTISLQEDLKSFDYYFNFIIEKFMHLAK